MTRVVVYHRSWGCETGCCGHVVEMGDREVFEFTHPYDEDPHAFAEELVRETFGDEHVADLDWDACIILED